MHVSCLVYLGMPVCHDVCLGMSYCHLLSLGVCEAEHVGYEHRHVKALFLIPAGTCGYIYIERESRVSVCRHVFILLN